MVTIVNYDELIDFFLTWKNRVVQRSMHPHVFLHNNATSFRVYAHTTTKDMILKFEAPSFGGDEFYASFNLSKNVNAFRTLKSIEMDASVITVTRTDKHVTKINLTPIEASVVSALESKLTSTFDATQSYIFTVEAQPIINISEEKNLSVDFENKRVGLFEEEMSDFVNFTTTENPKTGTLLLPYTFQLLCLMGGLEVTLRWDASNKEVVHKLTSQNLLGIISPLYYENVEEELIVKQSIE